MSQDKPDNSAAVLNLIAEMQAKLNHPDAGRLTKELATLVLQGVMPMVQTKRAA